MPNHETYIAGVQFRLGAKDHLDTLDGGHRFTLEPEPDNAYDEHAVKILDGDRHVGYVPGYKAREVGKLLQAGRVTSCELVRQGSGKIVVNYSEAP